MSFVSDLESRRVQSSQGFSGNRHISGSLSTATPYLPQASYGRASTSHQIVNKASILWRDFINGSKRRKRLLNRVREIAADEATTSSIMKNFLLELRQSSLRVIEDALEIEYRSQYDESKLTNKQNVTFQLPPISSFRGLNEKEDINILAEMISDCDDLLVMPNVKIFLPQDFPVTRNPFLLGRGVDELAAIVPPQPQPGNLEEELKILEVLRYKRSAKALLKAESQVLNKMPISLQDVERLWLRSGDDPNVLALLKAVCTILDNDSQSFESTGPKYRYLGDNAILMEPHEFLMMLNGFLGVHPIRVDVHAAIRQTLRHSKFDYFDDMASAYLIEWVNSILSNTLKSRSDANDQLMNSNNAQFNFGMYESQSHAEQISALEGSIGSIAMNSRRRGGASPTKLVHPFLHKGAGGLMNQPHQLGEYADMASMVTSSDIVSSVQVDKRQPQIIVKSQAYNRGPQQHQNNLSPVQQRMSPQGSVDGSLQFSSKHVRREQQKQDMNRRIKAEVDKVLRERGLNKEIGDTGISETDTIISMRYELVKMQQELLRRKVLDPRFYKVSSIDTTAANSRRLNAQPLDLALASAVTLADDTSRQVALSEKEIRLKSSKGLAEIVLEVVSDSLIGRIIRLKEVEVPSPIVDENAPIPPPQIKIVREPFAYARISKLILNRITKATLDSVVEANDADRLDILEPLYELMADKAFESPEPRGRVILTVNRVIFTTTLTQEGVCIDLLIKRNDECTGLVLVCTQLLQSAQSETGPITINVTDKELQVLLINQRGLYVLSQSKWSCMEMVAQWLASRVILKRIRVSDSQTAGLATRPVTRARPMTVKNSDNLSITSQLSEGTALLRNNTSKPPSAQANTRPDFLENAMASLAQTTGKIDEIRLSMSMVDISVDRKIEIAKGAQLQWKSRNVANIRGMTVKLSAWQDMEMIRFDITLTLPAPKFRKRKLVEADLIDFADYGETNSYCTEEVSSDPKQSQSVLVQLHFQLTGSELCVFGFTDAVDEQQVALNSLSQEDENHPSAFMWKVLNRMKVSFKGSTGDPYAADMNAEDPNNWAVDYDRRLIRDVRTISGGVMEVAVLAVGGELLYEAIPTDGSIFKSVSPKLFSELEISEMVYEEGWPLTMLDYGQRTHLAFRILEKIKVVEEKGVHRMEPYSYPETKMLTIVQQIPHARTETPVGSLEISEHLTLGDLRTLIKFEFDPDLVPKLYKFQYKGASCAVRQEPFRRAWDCLPKCIIIPRVAKATGTDEGVTGSAVAGLTVEESKLKAAAEQEKAKKETAATSAANFDIVKGQRRINRKLVPVPLATLCRVQENSRTVYLLHDSRDLFVDGDIIRIGDVRGRDYVVTIKSKVLQNTYPRQITIEPAFDLTHEVDFSVPISGNYPYPATGPRINGAMQLKTPEQLRFNYQVQEATKKKVNLDLIGALNAPVKFTKDDEIALKGIPEHVHGDEKKGLNELIADSFQRKLDVKTAEEIEALKASGKFDDTVNATTGVRDRSDVQELSQAILRMQSSVASVPKVNADGPEDEIDGAIYEHVWIWKCVPSSEDVRPRWRQLYDDGLIKYEYTYASNIKDGIRHFRVKAPFRNLEVLCTDARCPEMTIYNQRVNEMSLVSVDAYTELAFKGMTEWFPQFKKGIESSKFVKLMRECKAFPDIKRPARIGQLDLLFTKEVKGDNGIVEKYVNYVGFCRLLQAVALIRFPPGRGAGGKDDGDDSALEGDDASLSLTENGSLGNSLATNSLTANSGAIVPANKSTASGSRRPSIASGKSSMKSGKKFDKRRGSDASKSGASTVTNEQSFVDPTHAAFAYRKFVVDFVMTIPEWSVISWNESKTAAMKKLAVPYCAASRIATMTRGSIARFKYKLFKRSMICLQANVRRRIACKKTRKLISFLEQDWLFRIRYNSAMVMQSLVRKFLTRCWYCKIMRKFKDQQVIIQKARRFRLKKQRAQEKKGVLYRETKKVNGITVLMQAKRKDTRNYSKDYGVVIQVYIPKDQRNCVFPIEEADLRTLMSYELKVDSLSLGDLMDKRNLQRVVASRLIIRPSTRIGQPAQVMFSKQALGQRGAKALTRGRRISGDAFVCRVFETGYDITVQCYHLLSSKVFVCSITYEDLRDWAINEQIASHTDEIEKQKIPEILKKERKKDLQKWAVDRIVVDTRKRTFKVLFACQLIKSRKKEMITRIQALWRRALVRPKIIKMLDNFMLKINSHSGADEYNGYYLNTKTGASSWTKPVLLRNSELTAKPEHKWIELTYEHDNQLFRHFVNPYTGKYTHLDTTQAARIIQSLVRNHQLKTIQMPRADFLRVRMLVRDAKKHYNQSNHRLANIINYALVVHAVDRDEVLARSLYFAAVQLSELNPLVSRSFAVFMLGTCEPPVAPNRQRAMKLLEDAKRRDENNLKYAMAVLIFRYACLQAPKDVQCLVNCALVECLVFNNNFKAERLLRRALGISPFEERLVTTWNFLKERFPDRQLVYNPQTRVDKVNTSKGGKKRLIHGRPVAEDPAWAGWCYVEKDLYGVSEKTDPYWYNPADGTETLDQPNFKKQWAIRKQRSQFNESKMGLEYYYDALTTTYFQYHPLTDTYQ